MLFVSSDAANVSAILVDEARGTALMSKTKILFLASDPFKTHALALDREVKTITAQIRSAEYRDSLELVSAWAVRPDELQQLLLQHRPHVVHFSGHGTPQKPTNDSRSSQATPNRDLGSSADARSGQLVLMGDGEQPQEVSQEALVDLFSVLKDNIKVVVLNACFTKPQAEAIAEFIGCCIGTNAAIGDEAAIVFSTAFYRALAFGRDVETAFKLGKNELRLRGIREDQIHQLECGPEEHNPAKVILVDPRYPRRLVRSNRRRGGVSPI
jgi:hypothetical protein